MSEILSQNEIDDLLHALNQGEIDVNQLNQVSKEDKAVVYDFRRPNKFSKDHLRTLNHIYDMYSRLLASYLSGRLRTFCQAEVVSVESQTFFEFTNSLPEPVILAVIEFKPLNGSIIMELSTEIADVFIDRLLGGMGTTTGTKRNFTEVELTLLNKMFKQMLPLMDESWSNVINANFTLGRIETNPQFIQILSPNETIAIITMKFTVNDIKGMCNLCIPYVTIEAIIQELSTKSWYVSDDRNKTGENQSMAISQQLAPTILDISAILGNATITVKDLIELQLGDVIQLDTKANEEIVVNIGEKKKLKGILGTKHSRLAVQIIGVEKGD